MKWTSDPDDSPELDRWDDKIRLMRNKAVRWSADELDFEIGVTRAHP
jgi:hypothetical protein